MPRARTNRIQPFCTPDHRTHVDVRRIANDEFSYRTHFFSSLLEIWGRKRASEARVAPSPTQAAASLCSALRITGHWLREAESSGWNHPSTFLNISESIAS